MKKILILTISLFVYFNCFSQENRITTITTETFTSETIYVKKPKINNTIYTNEYTKDQYIRGCSLVRTGVFFFATGSILTASAIFANIADEKTKYIVFGTGGTLMTISFPLFCFGANNKRNAYYNQMILNSKK